MVRLSSQQHELSHEVRIGTTAGPHLACDLVERRHEKSHPFENASIGGALDETILEYQRLV
jgi:hypothetical protein